MPESTQVAAPTFEVKATLKATLELLRDIVTTACEGGIGYWSQLSEYVWSETNDTDNMLPFPRATLHAMNDDETAYEEKGIVITPEHIVAGIQKALEAGNPSAGNIIRALAEDDASYLDSEDADVIVQYGVLGEVVYG